MKEHTKIAVVLDRSGSMGYVREDTIGGFNAFLEEQVKAPGSADISLYQFDHEYLVSYENRPVAEAPKLDDTTFVPRGSTSLLDAIGRTVNSLGSHLSSLPEHERPNKVLVVIITDGHENSSNEFNGSQIKAMIRRQEEKYSWEFMYLGATLDAVQVATSLGFKGGSSASYSAAKTAKTFQAMSKAATSYRGMSASEREKLTAGSVSLLSDQDREDIG